MKPTTRKPDFEQLARVLERRSPMRPTLFEFFLNGPLYDQLAKADVSAQGNGGEDAVAVPADPERQVRAFRAAGYDYATTRASDFAFPKDRSHKLKTISQNEGSLIRDRESLEAYPWPDPSHADLGLLDRAAEHLSDGMKLIVHGPGGVLENVTDIVSYERLCFMLSDDEKLAADIFDAVGSRLVRYYELAGTHDSVGAMISNDDWGFKTQTMISPEMMRRYVFPWHKKIVEAIHRAGKPAILHSCGNLNEVMEDVIAGLGYDGKHSYEDAILPIEEAYRRYGSRIAVLGGIDVDFMCTGTPEEVYDRSKAMLAMSSASGGYALGSGNSIPEYVPDESYFAMTRAAWE